MDYFKLRDGYELFYKEDLIEKQKAILLISHGFAEHFNRYDYFTDSLNRNGYGVIRYDLRGHGRNKVDLGHVAAFDCFISDLKQIHERVLNDYPKILLVLLLHYF